MGVGAARGLKWFVAMLAIFGCLLSATVTHSHDHGIHGHETECASCDLEDVLSHGAAVVVSTCDLPDLSHIDSIDIDKKAYIRIAVSTALIRAPPVKS